MVPISNCISFDSSSFQHEKGVFSHCPVAAMSTAPGWALSEGSDASQQEMGVSAVVDGIRSSVCSDQFAVLSDTPPNNEETICHGGTATFGGCSKELNVRRKRVVLVTVVFVDVCTPSACSQPPVPPAGRHY